MHAAQVFRPPPPADPGEGEQIFQRQNQRSLFAGVSAGHFVRIRKFFLHCAPRRFRQIEPPLQKLSRRPFRRPLHQRMDPAAIGVTEHDDMFHFQSGYRVFQCGADAMVPCIRFARRDQIGDVTDDKEIPRRTLREQRRVHPGIRTGDHQNSGILTMFQLIKQFRVSRKIDVPETSKSVDQPCNRIIHRVYSSIPSMKR